MKNPIEKAVDFRQSPGWKNYMRAINWQVIDVDGAAVCIKPLAFGSSFIKIQHPLSPPNLKKIDALAKKYHAFSAVIEPHTYKYNATLYRKNGYVPSALRHAPSATRKIAITEPIDTIISTFSENAKRNIKKAQKNNLVIKTVLAKDDKDNTFFEKYFVLQKKLTDIKKFYAPGHTESMKKNKELKNSSFFTFAYESTNNSSLSFPQKRESGSPIRSGMTSDSKPIAAVWYGFYEGVVTYLQTGINQQGYDTLANYLLVLEGIKVGKKLQCQVFDFESIFDYRYPTDGTRWKGYSEFKKRFHGEEIYYPTSWIKLYNPLFRWFYNFSAPFIP